MNLKNKHDLLAIWLLGFIVLLLSLPAVPGAFRQLPSLLFVYFLSGYPLAKLFFPDSKANLTSLTVITLAFSLLLTYPAAVVTTILEGQSAAAIYSRHLTTSIFSLLSLYTLAAFLALIDRRRYAPPQLPSSFRPRRHLLLFLALGLYALLTLANLNRGDVFRDEYDLGFQAYDLVDGILAGRKAFTLSFSTHPPLLFHLKHFSMQILNPNGLDALADWQFRVTESILGLITLVITYLTVNKFASRTHASLAVILLSVNQYLVFLGRMIERSIYIAPFAIAAIYFALAYQKNHRPKFLILSGVCLGAALLVKASALTVIAAVAAFVFTHTARKFRHVLILASTVTLLYAPVLLYNLGAYLTVGLVDSNFSRLIGQNHPFATAFPQNPLVSNATTMVSLYLDQFSLPVLLLFLVALGFSITKKDRTPLEKISLWWLLFTTLFFWATVIRAYYISFITIPLAVIAAFFLEKLYRNRPTLTLMLVAVITSYSFLYSYQTHVRANYHLSRRYEDWGRSDTPFMVPSVSRHFSLSAREWTESRGWKLIQASVASYLPAEACLDIDPQLENYAVRRYFWNHDAIKRHYLGENYPTKFPRCTQNTRQHQFFLTHRLGDFGNLVWSNTGNDYGNTLYLYQTR